MSMSRDASDKRRFERIAVKLPVQYQLSNGEQWVQGNGAMEVVDVSLGGIRIHVDDALEVDSRLYLHVPLPEGSVYSMARTAWVSRHESGFVAGIEFIELGEVEREKLMHAARDAA